MSQRGGHQERAAPGSRTGRRMLERPRRSTRATSCVRDMASMLSTTSLVMNSRKNCPSGLSSSFRASRAPVDPGTPHLHQDHHNHDKTYMSNSGASRRNWGMGHTPTLPFGHARMHEEGMQIGSLFVRQGSKKVGLLTRDCQGTSTGAGHRGFHSRGGPGKAGQVWELVGFQEAAEQQARQGEHAGDQAQGRPRQQVCRGGGPASWQ